MLYHKYHNILIPYIHFRIDIRNLNLKITLGNNSLLKKKKMYGVPKLARDPKIACILQNSRATPWEREHLISFPSFLCFLRSYVFFFITISQHTSRPRSRDSITCLGVKMCTRSIVSAKDRVFVLQPGHYST